MFYEKILLIQISPHRGEEVKYYPLILLSEVVANKSCKNHWKKSLLRASTSAIHQQLSYLYHLHQNSEGLKSETEHYLYCSCCCCWCWCWCQVTLVAPLQAKFVRNRHHLWFISERVWERGVCVVCVCVYMCVCMRVCVWVYWPTGVCVMYALSLDMCVVGGCGVRSVLPIMTGVFWVLKWWTSWSTLSMISCPLSQWIILHEICIKKTIRSEVVSCVRMLRGVFVYIYIWVRVCMCVYV